MSNLLGRSSNDYFEYHQSYMKQTRYRKVELNETVEYKMEIISKTSESDVLKKNIAIEPVYVSKIDNEERLIYNSNMMEPDKKYQIMWNNEHFILVKTDFEISIYKFYPEKQ